MTKPTTKKPTKKPTTRTTKAATKRAPAAPKPIERCNQLRPALKRGEPAILLVALEKPPAKWKWWPGGHIIITHDGDRTPQGWTLGPSARTDFKTRTYDKAETLKAKGHASEFERQVLDLFDYWTERYTSRPAVPWIIKAYFPKRDVVVEWRV